MKLLLVLGEYHNNYDVASRLYVERFPERRTLSQQHDNRRLTERARNGYLVRQRRYHEFNENDARYNCFRSCSSSHISTRQIERDIDISQSTVSRILKALRYHPYHIILTQALRPNHIQLRIAFCQWALRIVQDDSHFFRYVLFSDEAKFYSDGQLNRHNCHYWPDENPYWTCRSLKSMESYGMVWNYKWLLNWSLFF